MIEALCQDGTTERLGTVPNVETAMRLHLREDPIGAADIFKESTSVPATATQASSAAPLLPCFHLPPAASRQFSSTRDRVPQLVQ
jgi:hypothetical protein